ncbi:MAG TPA: type III secretion inner membrane ring lipoprotein SctJ [Herbaspirillum sp.]|jgi:type III secretion protein J
MMKPINTVIASFLLLISLTACGNRTISLLNGLPEEDANMIVSALSQSGIAATKVAGDDDLIGIQVPTADQAAALAELHRRGLPRQNYASLGDIFKKDGIISTPLEEQARYVYALAQELEKTLSQLDDIVYVRVHPVLARKASLNGPAADASAGVLIKHRPDVDLTPMIPQIQALVAHSIPDLHAEQVSVIMAVAGEQPFFENTNGDALGTAPSGFIWWPISGGILLALATVGVYIARHRNIPQRPSAGGHREVLELNE